MTNLQNKATQIEKLMRNGESYEIPPYYNRSKWGNEYRCVKTATYYRFDYKKQKYEKTTDAIYIDTFNFQDFTDSDIRELILKALENGWPGINLEKTKKERFNRYYLLSFMIFLFLHHYQKHKKKRKEEKK